MKTATAKPRASRGKRNGQATQPTWEIAALFPAQGQWSVEEYLHLPGNHLIEFSDGRLEVLTMPTMSHQCIALFFYSALKSFAGRLGKVLAAPFPIQLWAGKFREPDVVFMFKKNRQRMHNEFWDGADLAIEVVSDDPESRRRDLVTKRREYARARIPEYWFVDPILEQVTVLRLRGGKYMAHGTFKKGAQARSQLLDGFSVNVSAALTASEDE